MTSCNCDTQNCARCEQEWRLLELERDAAFRKRGGANTGIGTTRFVDRKRAYRPDLNTDGHTAGSLTRVSDADLQNAGQCYIKLYSVGDSEKVSKRQQERAATLKADVDRSRYSSLVAQPKDRPTPRIVHVVAQHIDISNKPTRTAHATNSPTVKSRSERDAIRRAFIAWLNGRAYFAGDHATPRYWLKGDSRGGSGRTRIAPWDATVRANFHDVDSFANAAHKWSNPRNARTLATH